MNMKKQYAVDRHCTFWEIGMWSKRSREDFKVQKSYNRNRAYVEVEMHMITLEGTHSRCDSSGRQIVPIQRTPPDNIQLLQDRDIHSPCGIRNRTLSTLLAPDLRLKLHGHRGRHHLIPFIKYLRYYLDTVRMPPKVLTQQCKTFFIENNIRWITQELRNYVS
jgi:hypothetical protein